MICGNCGFNNVDGVASCANCGAAFVNHQHTQDAFNTADQGQQYNYQMYQQPYQNVYIPAQNENVSETVSIKEWVVSFLLMCIPVVNFVMPLIWAFSDSEKKSKSNFFKAYLIFVLVSIILSIVFAVLVFTFMSEVMTSADYTEIISELVILK